MKSGFISNTLRQMRYQCDPEMRQRIKSRVDAVWQERKRNTRPSPVMRFVAIRLAGAGLCLLIVLGAIGLLTHSTPVAYALDQTWEAIKDIRYFHFQFRHQEELNPGREAWIEYDESGELEAMRVNFYQQDQVVVWQDGVTQAWRQDANELLIFEDLEYSDKILLFARRFDPKQALNHLAQRVAAEEVRMEMETPSNPFTPIQVTAWYEPNTYVIGAPKPAMRETYRIDPNTKFVMDVEVSLLKDGLYTSAGVWEYLDYNQPFDRGTFDLTLEVPMDVDRFDTLDANLGFPQGDLSDEQAAKQTVKAFLESWRQKDYDEATRICGYRTSKERDRIHDQLFSNDLLRIITMEEAQLPEKSQRGFRIPCFLEFNSDGQSKETTLDILVYQCTPGRWRLRSQSLNLH